MAALDNEDVKNRRSEFLRRRVLHNRCLIIWGELAIDAIKKDDKQKEIEETTDQTEAALEKLVNGEVKCSAAEKCSDSISRVAVY
ncbi:hypothetical protein Tco_0377027 [Tanacetum coccineum]